MPADGPAQYLPRMTESRSDGYTLRLSEAELERYRTMAEGARTGERDLWAAAGIAPGATVADVGCGPGALFPALVAEVGERGRIIGVDGDATAVEQARAMVATGGWSNVEVREADAEATGLAPGSVDAVMTRHVLGHNGSREQAIVEHLATLVRPGGAVYLVDVFGRGFGIRPNDPDVDDLNDAYLRFHAARGNDVATGLRLDALLRTAGLDVIAYRGWYQIVTLQRPIRPPGWAARDAMVAAGIASDADVTRWDVALDRLTEQQPTLFLPIFGAVGRRAA